MMNRPSILGLRRTFEEGMDRQLPEFLDPPDGPHINIGGGSQDLPLVEKLDRHYGSGWTAPSLPFGEGSVACVYAFHFMEHLDGDLVVKQLKEIERVLMVGGVFNSVIPFWDTELAHQDLDHKSFWSENTWRNLFDNPYYIERHGQWRLWVHCCVIMGVAHRNLALVSQLVKE